MTRGLVLAAPMSGAGKTTLTLALLRAFRAKGIVVAGAKSGPDYIDPQFHHAASGKASVTLDAWAMDAASLQTRAAETGAELLLIEGAMGAIDGAGVTGQGSVSDLAQALRVPALLIIDAAHQAQSVALVVAGLRTLRPELNLAGVILNRIASKKHQMMAEAAITSLGVPVLGAVPRDATLTLEHRHLGLVQAHEIPELENFLDRAAEIVADACDLDAINAIASPITGQQTARRLPPLGQRIAIAQDAAFSFCYPHILSDWQQAGASIHLFSPLENQPPDPAADAIFLPGGYPELHAGPIAAALAFKHGMQQSAATGTRIYGECGGYMVLGDALTDKTGTQHSMLGLLPLRTSFETRKLTLGYRRLQGHEHAPWQQPLMGHEFHYATILSEGTAPRLFSAQDADENQLSDMGLCRGSVAGSFAHVICPFTG